MIVLAQCSSLIMQVMCFSGTIATSQRMQCRSWMPNYSIIDFKTALRISAVKHNAFMKIFRLDGDTTMLIHMKYHGKFHSLCQRYIGCANALWSFHNSH